MNLLTTRYLPQTATITLTEVVLDALSDIAYIFASNNPELVEQSLTLSETHLHLGSIHKLTPDKLPNEHESRTILQYRILMLEPTSVVVLTPNRRTSLLFTPKIPIPLSLLVSFLTT